MAFYEYEPLQHAGEFRLLRLCNDIPAAQPYKSLDELQLELITTSCEKAPPYETVSYAWGPSSQPWSLRLIDGSHIRVTETLREALPYICSACSSGYLWIDQLCINQADLAERSQQVAMMGTLYRKAVRLLVVITTDTQLADLISHLLSTIDFRHLNFEVKRLDFSMDRSHRRQKKFVLDVKKLVAMMGEEVRNTGKEYDDIMSKYCGAVAEVFESPWFKRIWTLQEALMSDRIVFLLGNTYISHRAVGKLTLLCTKTVEGWSGPRSVFASARSGRPIVRAYSGTGLYDYLCHHTRRDPGSDALSLSQFLRAKRYGYLIGSCEATDPRDIVFALRGTHYLPIDLNPNYGLSIREVFMRATRSVIDEDGNLSVLQLCKSAVQDVPSTMSLPSWVPDWSTRMVLNNILPGHDMREASSNKPEAYICPDHTNHVGDGFNDALWVKGRFLGNIAKLCGHCTSESRARYHRCHRHQPPGQDSGLEMPRLCATCHNINMALEGCSPLPDTYTVMNSAWDEIDDLVCVGHWAFLKVFREAISDRRCESTSPRFPKQQSLQTSMSPRIPKKDTASSPSGDKPWHWESDLESCGPYLFFAISSLGMLAMVPSDAVLLDQVALLQGMDVPVLLRQQAPGVFWLVGICYVDWRLQELRESFELEDLALI